MLDNRKDFELLNKLRELEARRIQAAYKTASNELEKLDEMTEKDLLKVIAAKLIMIEEKLNTLPLNLQYGLEDEPVEIC